MGTLEPKNNTINEMYAAQSLKIVKECADIVNTTKNPDVFFRRWELMMQHVENLCHLSGVSYTGTQPAELKQNLISKKQAAIHNMIDRYYEDIDAKAQKMKTITGKISQYSSFITNLEDYFRLMSRENVNFVNALYDYAMEKTI